MRPRTLVRLVFALIVLTAAGAAVAAVGGRGHTSTDAITACAADGSGRLRVISSGASCRAHEHRLSWNVRGPQGVPGPAGPAGPAGAQGERGPQGETGSQGAVSISYGTGNEAIIVCSTSGGGSPAGVRVNELMTGVTGAAANEFVELVNAGPEPIDASGYRVVYRSAAGTSDTLLGTLPAGTILAAGGHYLLGGAGYAGPAPADQSFATGMAAMAGGVGVRNADGTLLDSVGYGATAANGLVEGRPATAPPTTASPGSSVGRMPNGTDTNDNSVDFAVSATPTPRGVNG
jgi:hypothetical protein